MKINGNKYDFGSEEITKLQAENERSEKNFRIWFPLLILTAVIVFVAAFCWLLHANGYNEMMFLSWVIVVVSFLGIFIMAFKANRKK